MMTSEVQLAAAVIAWLESESWTVYQEVVADGRIADIVAVRHEDSWIVECKMQRSAKVMDQAMFWKGQANRVSVAVPKTKTKPQGWWDIELHLDGCGEFTVDDQGEVVIRLSPIRKRLDDLGIRSYLNEAQKDFAEAGNATGERWSPFQETARMLLRVAELDPGFCLSDYITSDYKAESIRRSIQRGAIKGLVVRQGKVYPESYDHHSVKRSKA